MIKVKVIELPREGLTSQMLEEIISSFIATEQPDEIIQMDFNSEFSFLTIIYKKG
jgi:hypothetical protein